jgi:hypothetical protein
MLKDKIKIKFYHGLGKHRQPSTTAILSIVKKSYIGTVTMYKNDTYSKSNARKFSLEKAISFTDLNKEDRKEIWSYYKSKMNIDG